MIASSSGVPTDLVVAVVGGVIMLLLGAIAWFFRAWAAEVKDEVKDLGTKVDRVDDKLDETVNAVGQLQVVVGWPQNLRIGSGRRGMG